MSALASLMVLGFVGLLVSGFFLSQGYSMYSTFYFALAAAAGRSEAGLSTDIGSPSFEGPAEGILKAGV